MPIQATSPPLSANLADRLGGGTDPEPVVTFVGSGDFHHVSLALLRRLTRPFNLLVIDKHPDWMRGVPLLHCGTWLNHAARLPLVRHVFHVGGDLDFDNAYRWLAPWGLLRERRVTVFPARQRFRRGRWANLNHEPLRADPHTPVSGERMEQLLAPHRDELARWPLYVSLDKDVMRADEAVVNWDSGDLALGEVAAVLAGFREAAADLAGMDMVGDWSPVEVRGAFRRLLHWLEHPALTVHTDQARQVNEHVNLALLDAGARAPSAARAGVRAALRACRGRGRLRRGHRRSSLPLPRLAEEAHPVAVQDAGDRRRRRSRACAAGPAAVAGRRWCRGRIGDCSRPKPPSRSVPMAAWRALPASWQTRSMWSTIVVQRDAGFLRRRLAADPAGDQHPGVQRRADDGAAPISRLIWSSVSCRWSGTSARQLWWLASTGPP